MQLSAELCAFLGLSEGSQLPRNEVTQKLAAYVREKGLQLADKKKVIQRDDALQALLKVPADVELTYMNLQSYLSPHLTAVPAAASPASA